MSFTPFVSDDQVTAQVLSRKFDQVAAEIPGIVSTVPSGIIASLSQNSAPDGWLLCDGSAVSRSVYAALFTTIGTTFGAGDGLTTFNLPDLRGRTPMGAGAGAGLTARTLGQSFGVEQYKLLAADIPLHDHTVSAQVSLTIATGAGAQTRVDSGTTASQSTGGNLNHNNMQPSLALTWMIKT